MSFYISESSYIAETTEVSERLARIKSIIIALENQMLLAAEDVGIADYSMNDGQIQIKTAYRDPSTIAKAIDMYDKMYTRLFNRYNGCSIVSLRDARSFNLNSRW